MQYLLFIDVSLSLAILATALSVASLFIWDRSIPVLMMRIRRYPTRRSGADAAQKLLALPNPGAIETSRKLMLGYKENFQAAKLLIDSLESVPNPQWTDVLIQLSLQKENPDIRHRALWALESVRQTENTLNIFMQLFRDPDPAVSAISAWVLARTGHREAIAFLLRSGAPDSEIEKLAQPPANVDAEFSPYLHNQMFHLINTSRLSDVDTLKLGMYILRRVDKYPMGVVNALFQLRNRGAYLALAQSLEAGLLLDTETLRSLAHMGYCQVAGRLTDDLLRFGWQSGSRWDRPEEDVWLAKTTLENFLREFSVQIPMHHLHKIAEIQDFYYWTHSPVRVQLSGLRDEAMTLIARHLEFWNESPEEDVVDENAVVPSDITARAIPPPEPAKALPASTPIALLHALPSSANS
jgi:HEAT repeats